MTIEIDLSGPEGNAYHLLSLAKKLAQAFDMDWPSIRDEMTSGDYENLLAVFKEHFSDYVRLIR